MGRHRSLAVARSARIDVKTAPYSFRSTAFFGAFADVLFIAGSGTTLQAALLPTADRHGYAVRQYRFRGAFAVSFGTDFVGHGGSSKSYINLGLSHKSSGIRQSGSIAPMQTTSPLAAIVVQLPAVGAAVRAGQVLVVLESMKMEHELLATADGVVQALCVQVGEAVAENQTLLISELLTPTGQGLQANITHKMKPHAVNNNLRTDLQAVVDRHAFTLDAQRPEAVYKRHALGLRTARENVADLVEAGSFIEYGALAVAAQTQRRSAEDLQAHTPADGIITGIGRVAGRSCAILAYDATVLAGTQGMRSHQKTDRMIDIALAQKLPVVLFAEGGGGRPGDTDMPIVAGLHVRTFARFARLHGQVPVVGIAARRCFAGNAALLGCCDVIIATKDSNIGMGGPAMVEGGGLGRFAPEAIGPSSVQSANGVIDVLADDEATAVRVAKQYLGFFPPVSSLPVTSSPVAPVPETSRAWPCADQTLLRAAVPENRLRSYDARALLHTLCDTGSVLELRAGFAKGMVTALARVAGRTVGVLANNNQHLGGAIDGDAADKAVHFMRLCSGQGWPLVSLVDTPGFMVGPDTEATAQVRRASALFLAAAQLKVPFFAIVLRKGYGLGAMAMTAGGFHAPVFTVAWPSAEFGAMGLEGAVKLGYARELAAQPDDAAREALHQQLVAQQYSAGHALNMAATLEIDAVIDPADTRAWLLRGLVAATPSTAA
jgi:acetyl-CoA carboxylase carboxyltransferase component